MPGSIENVTKFNFLDKANELLADVYKDTYQNTYEDMISLNNLIFKENKSQIPNVFLEIFKMMTDYETFEEFDIKIKEFYFNEVNKIVEMKNDDISTDCMITNFEFLIIINEKILDLKNDNSLNEIIKEFEENSLNNISLSN